MPGAFDGRALLIVAAIVAVIVWMWLGARTGGTVARGKHDQSTRDNTDGAGVAGRGRKVG